MSTMEGSVENDPDSMAGSQNVVDDTPPDKGNDWNPPEEDSNIEKEKVESDAVKEEDRETLPKSPERSAENQNPTIDTSNLTRLEKAKLGNLSYEEETELRKHTSIGAILSGLSTGSYGSKAKENVVSVEAGVKRSRFNSNYGYNSNKRYRSDWGNNMMWNSWNEEMVQEEVELPQSNEDWIAEENKLLEEELGPGVVSIMYDEDHGMMYICEICQSQMNGRKSLDVHLNGMKHLKKKNLWEKQRRGEGIQSIPVAKEKGTSGEEKEKKDIAAALIKPQGDIRMEGGNSGPTGYGQGILQNYNQPPPFGMPPPLGIGAPGLLVLPQSDHVVPAIPGPQKAPRGQWGNSDTIPPPPPVSCVKETPSVEEKPKVKTNLSGGATGTLLQKLAACAVKNLKDSDLATNVVISLVKSMKEYNHVKGDTRSIEVLTEIDIKLRGLKAQMPVLNVDSEKKPNSNNDKTLDGQKSNKIPSVTSDPSQNSAHPYYSSANRAQSSDSAGTWYSQGKGTSSAPPNQHHSPGPNQNQTSSKSIGGYSPAPTEGTYSRGRTDNQTPYNSYSAPVAPKAVIDIIQSSTAPPPPPPPESGSTPGYVTQEYTAAGYQGGYHGYYNAGRTGSQYSQQY